MESNQTEQNVKKKDKLPKNTCKSIVNNKIREVTINKIKQTPLPKRSKTYVDMKNKATLHSTSINNKPKIFGTLQLEADLNRR